MDVLTRIRDLLGAKKSQKRKSSLGVDYGDLERSKKIRMSELNGDYELKSHPHNSEIHYNSSESRRNYSRRSESYVKNNYQTNYFGLDHSTEPNGIDTNYRCHNGTESKWNDFKAPMPITQNGLSRIPDLVAAKKTVFDGARIFHRSTNQPQQTVPPHYTRFGEPRELINFKSIPDLYPIHANRSNVSCSVNSSQSNGCDQSIFAAPRFANSLSVPPAMNASNTLPSNTTSIFGRLLEGPWNSARASTTASKMGSKSKLTQYNNEPPKNLSLSRYENMLNMIPGIGFLSKSKKKAVNDSSDQSGFIDLSEDADLQASTSSAPSIARVNSLKARLQTKEVFANPDWEQNVNKKYNEQSLKRRDSLRQLREESIECERRTRDKEEQLQENFNKITISSLVYDEEEEEEPANDYPSINDKQPTILKLISGRDTGTVLISKFNLSVTRHDIQTLQWNPLTWLNDEVINFYMELLAERSRSNEKLPKVHGMNTFFLKRLMENGYSGVRRWTRKVDIFAHDIIPVPVHKGIHWCMSIIHLKNKTIKYYDSMGAPNNPVLTALANYLKEESLDKKKVEFDMTGWTFENVRNIPQQENGSDCGVFSCMYAEFITRNRPIVFTQQHMVYFRMKMLYEICSGQMLN